jgi:uncharacterized oxidoreductase
MPVFKAEKLQEAVRILMQAAGAKPDEAATVSRYSVAANLAGHDSHGVIMLPSYIDRMGKGHIVPGAPFEVKKETDTTLVIDGNWGFGYVVTERAMQMTIAKAKKHNVAATTVYRQSHVGRVGAYPLIAAKDGLIAMMTADSGRSPKHVAPFGGSQPRLGTNPISIAIPSDLEAPFYIDMATSAVAVGKIKLAQARGAAIPEGWVIDKHGKNTTDPKAYDEGGVLLPLGGAEGHKGFGLSAMVEILSGLLTGLGFGIEPTGRHNDGCFIACFNVAALRDLKEFKKEVAEFARYLKATPPSEGFSEVLYPGEIEWRREQERRKSGVEVEDKTWSTLLSLGEKFGVKDKMLAAV